MKNTYLTKEEIEKLFYKKFKKTVCGFDNIKYFIHQTRANDLIAIREFVESKKHTDPDCGDDGCGVNQTLSDILKYLETIEKKMNYVHETNEAKQKRGEKIRIDIKKYGRELSPTMQKVLEMRWGLKDGSLHTYEEVGREFGVTRERIRQIEAKAFEIMRKNGNNEIL